MPVIQGSVRDVIVSSFQQQVSFLPLGGVTGQVVESQGAAAPIFADPGAMLTPSAGSVILAPTTSARNTIQPTTDSVTALTLQSHSPTPAVVLAQALTSTGFQFLQIADPNSSFSPFSIGLPNGVATTPFGVSTGNTDNPLKFALALFSAFQGNGNYYGEVYVDYDASLIFWHPATNAGTDKIVGRIQHGMLDPTNATYKGRMLWFARDSNAEREAIRIEADGSAARIGFYGTTAVVQQANASSAGVSGIVAGAAYAQADMAAVKAAITAIRAGLAANGLLANTA